VGEGVGGRGEEEGRERGGGVEGLESGLPQGPCWLSAGLSVSNYSTYKMLTPGKNRLKTTRVQQLDHIH